MARLVIKNGYLKGSKAAAHLHHLVKYIATRDGVEKIPNGRELWHSTKNQQTLIAHIVREFPESKESLEYEDYITQPNRENASEFISITLEQHIEQIGDREKYLDYIANRPRAEKFDTHGLFTASDTPLVLEQVANEVSEHTGNVWTPIISLRREDADKFGFENAAAWKALISSKAMEFADSLKIHPDHLKWYAAFHNESHHPHVHMICYSTNPQEGYLTKPGIRKMKSALSTEIFRQELIPLYGEKTQRQDELSNQSRMALRELLVQMQGGTLQNEKIEQLLTHLEERMKHTTGRKQYGYLKAELKNVVDEIVDELARDERVAEAYRLWQEAKSQINHFYSDQSSEPLPLSKCDDFKSIRNMVIKEAMQLADGTLTFEEPTAMDSALPELTTDEDIPSPSMEDDTAEPEYSPRQERIGRSGYGNKSKHPNWWTDEYKLAKQYLHGDEDKGIAQDFEKAKGLLLSQAAQDNPLAMFDLGRMSADGLGCEADTDVAQQWYAKALATFQITEAEEPWKYTEYRIGKMYAAGLGTERDYEVAAHWLTLSANEKYKYAEYSLGGLYYHGKGVEQNHETAFDLYTRSAKQSFPYASFELGKMLRDGIGCAKNKSDSDSRFAEAFVGFTSLEQQSHDDTAIDAEKFCKEKSALFIVLPEEDLTKYFMVSLMIQQLYREILAVADENGGKLKNRVVFYCDELGTLPAIQSLELIFSASRSRRLTMVPIIQSFGQLQKNYGKEGSEIIVDNCQDTIFGGFAPNSQTAEVLSKAMGSRTVMSGSISRGKNDPSQSLQMMERPLMTADELKSIPKGNFVVMKTGTHPMKTKLRLFLDWGIIFDGTYTVSERAHRKVSYADKQVLEENIVRKHTACVVVDEDTGELLEPPTGTGTLHTPVAEQAQEPKKRKSHVRTQ
ncbi:MobP3 family relaxase [Butyricicoccus sp. Marseille-Q5471]|uniref:MobP3 family relaxase n=1 Tax=Butyricicoccus sp. Marseille-Q5471 TaxID=3039493 RepID=UPI002F40C7E0